MTPFEIKMILELRSKGISYEKIAGLLQHDTTTIRRHAIANGAEPPTGPFWTPVTTQKLRDLLAVCKIKNLSASDMARELGCSRNAIIGKAHRLGVDLRTGNDGGARRGHEMHQRRSKAVLRPYKESEKKFELPPEPTTDTWIRMVDIGDKQCRWPVSDPPDHNMLCCGAERAHDGTRYCFHHWKLSVNRPKEMKEEYL